METGGLHCRSQLLPVDGPFARLLEQFIGFRKMLTSKESPVHRQWGGMGCLQDMVTLLKKNRVECSSRHIVPLDCARSAPPTFCSVFSPSTHKLEAQLCWAQRHRATSATLTTQLFQMSRSGDICYKAAGILSSPTPAPQAAVSCVSAGKRTLVLYNRVVKSD